jgi:F-type H+-transporting ATPase subunit gamma
MTRLAELQRHIASLDELLDIVGAMRSLAGMRVQESQQALPGIRSYAEAMATAVGAALLLASGPAARRLPRRRQRAVIVCTSEHGFVGGFNERMLVAAETEGKSSERLFLLGSRGAALAFERGLKATWTAPMATHLPGVPDAVNRLTGELYAHIARGEIEQVDVLFGRSRLGAALNIEHRQVLPIEPARLALTPAQEPPLHNLRPGVLLEKLVAEYVFALLTEAAVESLASENAARFAAMESAHDNVSRKLEGLQGSARQARQSEITAELLDLITGAEAMASGAERNSPRRT